MNSIARAGVAVFGLVIALAVGTPRAPLAAAAMGDGELRALLRLYNETRKAVAIQTDVATIAGMLAERDVAAAKIVAASGGRFERWLATARVLKWHESGRFLGYRVELVTDTSLQTYIGNDDDQTATMIPMNDPLADAAQASRDRLVLVSGAMQLKDGAPIDVMARSSKAGIEVSLLVKFTAITKR